MQSVLINLQHIYKSYRTGRVELPVLADLNLKVEQGEYVAVMGPSGSGKSTLMNILGCLERPSSGLYTLGSKQVSRLLGDEIDYIRNHQIGFVFQQFNLMPQLNALKNVALPAIYAGEHPQSRNSRALELLEQVGMGRYRHHKPAELSGGQQQRVAIARALMNKPSLLLADEPTGALDTRTGEAILALFDALHSEGLTVVMITHSQEVASRATRLLHMQDGRLTDGALYSLEARGDMG